MHVHVQVAALAARIALLEERVAHSGIAAGSTRLRDFAPQLHAHAAAMQAYTPLYALTPPYSALPPLTPPYTRLLTPPYTPFTYSP